MTKRPKILVLTPDKPYPIRAGGQMRMSSLLPALAECASVHVVSMGTRLGKTTTEWSHALGIAIEALPASKTGRLRDCADRLKTALSLTNLRFRREEKRLLDDAFLRVRPDLVWLETPYLVRYALDWARRVPVIVDYWGTSEGLQRIHRLCRGASRLPAWIRWRLALNGERRYAPRVSAIVSVSELDARFFRRIAPGRPVAAIPNCITKQRKYGSAIQHSDSSFGLIFTGDMSYRPNVDAALYFAKKIFPTIRIAVPHARIVFCGRHPLPEVQALASVDSVEVTGEVDDLGAHIARAAVYVLPMRLGSGIRSKLFDVFPLGIPIVATSVGAEGLALSHGQNCLIADSAAEFAKACIRLLKCPEERQRLGDNACRLAEEVYSPEAIRQQVKRFLGELLARPVCGVPLRPGGCPGQPNRSKYQVVAPTP